MKMKKLLILFLITIVFISCDKIEGPYRINNGNGNPIDTNTFIKKILLEDYSGHTCSNCPNAARELEALIDIYGDKIVPITVHVGKTYARPYSPSQAPKYQYDFRTQAGESWNNLFQITNLGLPKGMVNRIGVQNSTHGAEVTNWNPIIQSILNDSPNFGINISSNSSANNSGFVNQLDFDISIKILNTLQGDFNLIVCLTEDSIVNWQKDIAATPNVDVENYVHRHVLRASINTEWGELLQTSSSYYKDDEINKNYSINLDELQQFNINYSLNTLELGNGNSGEWNINKLYIVVFIYDYNTFEIQQVEEKKLITQ